MVMHPSITSQVKEGKRRISIASYTAALHVRLGICIALVLLFIEVNVLSDKPGAALSEWQDQCGEALEVREFQVRSLRIYFIYEVSQNVSFSR